MYLTISNDGMQLGQKAEAIAILSVYEAFEQVPDGRKDRGKRYPLALVLTLLLGTVAGEQTVSGIVAWTQKQKHWPMRYCRGRTRDQATGGPLQNRPAQDCTNARSAIKRQERTHLRGKYRPEQA